MTGRGLNLFIVVICVGKMVRWIDGLQVLVGVRKGVSSSIGTVQVGMGVE